MLYSTIILVNSSYDDKLSNKNKMFNKWNNTMWNWNQFITIKKLTITKNKLIVIIILYKQTWE